MLVHVVHVLVLRKGKHSRSIEKTDRGGVTFSNRDRDNLVRMMITIIIPYPYKGSVCLLAICYCVVIKRLFVCYSFLAGLAATKEKVFYFKPPKTSNNVD